MTDRKKEIEDAIAAALEPFKFDLMDDSLWSNVKQAIEPVLQEIAARRKPAISVVCDKANNDPENIALGRLNVKLVLDPALATEHDLEMWNRIMEARSD